MIQQWVTFGFIEISSLNLQEKQQLLQMQGILDQLYILFGKQLTKTKNSEAQNVQLQNKIKDLKREKQYLELQKELLEIKLDRQNVDMTSVGHIPIVDSKTQTCKVPTESMGAQVAHMYPGEVWEVSKSKSHRNRKRKVREAKEIEEEELIQQQEE